MRPPFWKTKPFLVLSLVATLFLLNGISLSVRDATVSLLSPLHSLLWKTGAASSSSEIKRIELENLSLSQQLLVFKETAKENERLRQALDIGLEKEFDLSLLGILGKEVDDDVLIVGKGKRDGIARGMPVITQSRVAVGSIGEVGERTSRLVLLSSKQYSSDAKVQGGEVFGVLRGKGRSRAVLDLIPQEQELQEGAVVVSSALGGLFPDNLLVGEITKVQKSDVEAFQQGEVKLYFAPTKDNTLFAITNWKP